MVKSYDKDIRRLRIILPWVLCIVAGSAIGAAYRGAWITAFCSALWTLTCCLLRSGLDAMQKTRDEVRLLIAVLRQRLEEEAQSPPQ